MATPEEKDRRVLEEMATQDGRIEAYREACTEQHNADVKWLEQHTRLAFEMDALIITAEDWLAFKQLDVNKE